MRVHSKNICSDKPESSTGIFERPANFLFANTAGVSPDTWDVPLILCFNIKYKYHAQKPDF